MVSSAKTFYEDKALIFQGFQESLEKAGEYNKLYKFIAWVLSWIFSTDHKRVGILYLITMTIFFAIGIGLGLTIRLELFLPGEQFISARVYNSVFTMHGVIMIFLVVIPGIPATFGNFCLPLQLGAPDVSFPKLNLSTWWLFILGAGLAVLSLFVGTDVNGELTMVAPDGGWTFYVPYSLESSANISLALSGAFILGFSSMFTGMNFITTIHRMRAKGMGFFQMPLFCWSLYATSWIQVLATPVVSITLLLVIVERFMGIGIFDPAKGGDPVLYQHMFWIYSHPAVYLMVIPAMGVVSDVMAVFSRRTIFGYKAIALSSMAIAFVGYFVWAHHMFTSGMSETAQIVFSFLTFFVAIPTAIKTFNWIATLYRGSIHLSVPMVWALTFIFLFSIGGLTGLLNGAINADLHVHDTAYVVGHFHYTMFGGGMVGMFCACHYWFPKITGKIYNETVGLVAWAFFFIGFNTLYGSMLVMGLLGMPRRYHDYLPQFTVWHQISTIGAIIMVTGLIIMFVNLLKGWISGEKAKENHWDAKSLEWTHCTSPPILLNFDKEPEVTGGPYDFEGEWL
ncbi:MAG: cytochrome c oxidase subunit I [Candidatus Cloacimonadota bacterium]|nr:MAG: cytochrome c oxidase subunit I [Candidatus Cloacimonadota bacterium]